jgi:hypothetical protein
VSIARRVRGVFATSLIWAIGWVPFGIAAGFNKWSRLGAHLSMEWSWPPLSFVATPAAGWATWGAINGALFAVVLTTGARPHGIEALSVGRTALWGALTALAFPSFLIARVVVEEGLAALALEPAIPMLGFAAALGAGLGAGTLILARRNTNPARTAEGTSDIRRAAT